MAETVFVTGGTGFIGAHLLLQLAEKGYQVRALKRETASTDFFHHLLKFYGKTALTERIEWIPGDINDAFGLLEAVKGCTSIYHSAGKVSFDQKDWDQLLAINKHGTANVVNAALEAGVKKFCLFSSVAALDMSLGIKGKKTDWKHFRKTQPYGYSKYLSELEAFRGQEEGLEICIIRPAVVLGPSGRSNGLNRFIGRLRRGIAYYPIGTTGYIDVQKLCSSAIALMEANPPEQVIMCQGNLRFKETMFLFCEVGGFKKPAKKLDGLSLWFLKKYVGIREKMGLRMALTSSGLTALSNTGGYDHSAVNPENIDPKTLLQPAIEEAVKFYQFQKEQH